MNAEKGRAHADTPRLLLRRFVLGSLIVLLLCLCATALVFSAIHLKKERQRAGISSEQLSYYFGHEHRSIAEEMWTRNFEGIRLRVASIAQSMGHAAYRLVLLDESGACVHASTGDGADSTPCEVPARLRAAMPRFAVPPGSPELGFDTASGRYVYMVPLYVGATLKGYLYAEISDPYDFYRGGSATLALRIFIVPIACVILIWLGWLLVSQKLIVNPYLSKLLELEKRQALGVLAAQVAHDIRSPLVALKSVISVPENLRGLDETRRRLVLTAASRIENIANDLVSEFSGRPGAREVRLSFVSSVVEAIVAEKRAELGPGSMIELRTRLPEQAYAARVGISVTDLARVVSNLVNNSIEALSERASGNIGVTVAVVENSVRLVVADDGAGIAAPILRRLRTLGGSFSKAGGAGLGLQHAKAVVGSVSGSLSLESIAGTGTTVTLEIPLAEVPSWFAAELDLSDAETVVILDDDPSVHLLWKSRLGGAHVVHLTDPEQFCPERFPRARCRYVFDHEILGSPVTGMDLISSHRLGDRAVLVTSYSNDPKLQRAVVRAGAKMLPKGMIADVRLRRANEWRPAARTPISTDAPRPAGSLSPIESKPRARAKVAVGVAVAGDPYDLVLIDDDPLMHQTWASMAQLERRRLLAVYSFDELPVDRLDRDVPVYVDKNLGQESGLVVARRLRDLGFTDISLATGEELGPADLPAFLRSVRNKEYPLHHPQMV